MDIDKHDIQILATKISKILIESSYNLLKIYPKASFVFCSLFILYIFFPAIFWLLINTTFLVVLIGGISIKTYIILNKERAQKHENAKDGKSPREVESTQDASNTNKKYDLKHARSVRRRKSKIVFAESSSQDNIQEKEAVSSTNFSRDLVDKRPLPEETPKEIREVEVNAVNDRVGSFTSNVFQDFRSQFNAIWRFQSDVEGSGSENTKDEGDDSRGDLADLGLSEIERNKRLEILIARRRERKFLNRQASEMMNMGDNKSPWQMMYSIERPKMHSFSHRNAQPIPGSAPSASFLPTRNPFDLPYEPHEEKPILTEDSFFQEFLGTHPKDKIFSRHKTFSSGGILPRDMTRNLHQTSLHNYHGIKQETTELRLGEKDGEKKAEHEQSQEAECDDKVENTDKNISDQGSEQGSDLDGVSHEDIENEVKTKSVIVEDYNDKDSFSSSSDENEPIPTLDREKLLKSLSSLSQRNKNIQRDDDRMDDNLFDHGLSRTDKTREIGPFGYRNVNHASCLSLASDMQVEVSELGSPRLLSDGSNSSPDEVRSLCDSKFEKEIPADEGLWITSSQLSRVGYNGSRSRDLRKFSEEDTIGVGFSRIKESKILAERIITQNSYDPHSHYVSESELPEDDEYRDYIERIVHEQRNSSCPNSSHDLKPENLQSHEEKQLTGTSRTDIFCNTDLQNPKDSESGSEAEERLKATIANGSTGESAQPTFVREFEGMPEELLQHTEVHDSRSTEGNYILESTTDTEDEASSIALATSEPSQFVIHPNVVSPAHELLNKHVPTALSTSSSPKSVLNLIISTDQGSISHLNDVVQMENPRPGGESCGSNSISPTAQMAAP